MQKWLLWQKNIVYQKSAQYRKYIWFECPNRNSNFAWTLILRTFSLSTKDLLWANKNYYLNSCWAYSLEVLRGQQIQDKSLNQYFHVNLFVNTLFVFFCFNIKWINPVYINNSTSCCPIYILMICFEYRNFRFFKDSSVFKSTWLTGWYQI